MFAISASPEGSLAFAARALIALAAGLTVTFVADHSAAFGLVVFGAFALATGVALAWIGSRVTIPAARIGYWISAAVAIACATVALSSRLMGGGGLGVLVATLVSFAGVTGVVELSAGLRLRQSSAHAKDTVITGILSIVLAVIVLLIPFDFANAWETITKDGAHVSGVVTADVFIVGIFGVWAVVLGAFLAIVAVSMRLTVGTDQQKERELVRVAGEE